jgi:hypothetical protein
MIVHSKATPQNVCKKHDTYTPGLRNHRTLKVMLSFCTFVITKPENKSTFPGLNSGFRTFESTNSYGWYWGLGTRDTKKSNFHFSGETILLCCVRVHQRREFRTQPTQTDGPPKTQTHWVKGGFWVSSGFHGWARVGQQILTKTRL